MSSSAVTISSMNSQPVLSLRERKKLKTRASIREHALRLFLEQGYEATTVEQIAAEAEISPSTFWRYFPTKEDVVLQDDLDLLFAAAFNEQPPELSPIEAFRRAMRHVLRELPPEELDADRARQQLIIATPELRAAMIDELSRGVTMLAELTGRRVGRDPEDLAVRTFAGAVTGIAIAAYVAMVDDPEVDLYALIDAGLEQLAAGLPL